MSYKITLILLKKKEKNFLTDLNICLYLSIYLAVPNGFFTIIGKFLVNKFCKKHNSLKFLSY